MSTSQQKRPTRKRDKETSTIDEKLKLQNDAHALTSALLGAWAWHPDSAQVLDNTLAKPLPVEFDSVDDYKNKFVPLIISEACANLQRQFQEEAASDKRDKGI